MAQVKMKYGIDLGTTNSAICRMENGEPTIIKTSSQKDILPSCVAFTKKKVAIVGDKAVDMLIKDRKSAAKHGAREENNVFIEFKRTMGLDTKYSSAKMERSFSSEELSAEVLKALKSFVSDDNMNAAVITIPAKFKADQIAATKRAAILAGIEHCELLQEPIAAAMAYGLNTKKKSGTWLVFDFGGGTFDAALLKVEDSIMQVIDTEGDNYLGGKNLDYAIIDKIMIPRLREQYVIDELLSDDNKKNLLRDALKPDSENYKNQLSFNDSYDFADEFDSMGEDDEGEDIGVDMKIMQSELQQVIAPIFQKAIDICINLLERNNLKGRDLDSLILIGGPTYSPILRKMLKEQITSNVDTSIDPMTAVARGAALYASGIDCEIKGEMKSGTIALDLAYESSSVESMEFVSIKLLRDECTGNIPSRLFVEFTRGDKAWASGKIEINETGDVVECQLIEGRANVFTIVAYDEKGSVLPCFPNEVNIMQGIVVGSAVLPYNIGIEVHDSNLNRDVCIFLKGLEKNQSIPAIGVCNGLKTPSQLRPGMNTDKLVIPIYQGEFETERTNAIHNDHVFDVEITGDDIPVLIPVNSDLDVTMKVDRSQLVTVEVTFLVIDETIVKKIDIGQRSGVDVFDLQNRLEEAKRRLYSLQSASVVDEAETVEPQKMLDDVSNRFDGEKNSEDGKMHLLADLRRAFLKIEEVENAHEWESLEADLRSEFERLEKANNEFGNKYNIQVEELRRQTDAAICKKDMSMGRQVLDDINSLFITVTLIYQLIGFVQHHSKNFGLFAWKDSARARQLLNQGGEIVNSNPTVDVLHPLVCSIIDLMDMPESQKPIIR